MIMTAVQQATGRRKTSIATIVVTSGKGNTLVNKKDLATYFPNKLDQDCILAPLRVTEQEGKYDIRFKIIGGGITGQKEAARLALARALVAINSDVRSVLKSKKYLTRDPRKVERKKPGLLKARKKRPFKKR